jgi:hypothetical protein
MVERSQAALPALVGWQGAILPRICLSPGRAMVSASRAGWVRLGEIVASFHMRILVDRSRIHPYPQDFRGF